MKVKAAASNFRIEVTPRRLGDMGYMSTSDSFVTGGDAKIAERMYRERCEEIVSQIKRHCDDVGYIEVKFDQPDVCEFCGADWTEAGTYNGCCHKDEAAEDARLAALAGASQ